MGTLATVLAKKKIRTLQDRFQATVVGDIEDVGGVLKITRINVSYRLKVPKEKSSDARAALDGGKDGLDFLRRIVSGLSSILSEGALVAFEIAPGQADAAIELLAGAGALESEVVEDLSGRDRVVIARMA